MSKLTESAIRYCEKYGIYEVLYQKGNRIVYYSYYPDDINYPFIRVVADVVADKEIERRTTRYRNVPKFLKGELGVRYNYCCG